MMNYRFAKLGMLASCAVAAIVVGAPAHAQTSDREAGASGDIIVTARRSEERLQDVPISITVFNQQQISDRNVVVAADLAIYTPSLSINQKFGPEKAAFAIRGFNQDNSTAPTVGTYFADVVEPRAQGGTQSGGNPPAGSFMDLQNVQVLKGPQGTLFGRNTTGGAVLLVPQKPTDKLEGYVEGSIGDYGLRRVEAVLNVPLADTFKVRFGIDRNKREGYIKNVSGIGPKDYNDVNYFAARMSIVADLTPDLENYTVAIYSNSFSHGYGSRIVGPCDPAPSASTFFTYNPGCNQIARQNARGDGPLTVEINNPDAYARLRQWQVINTTTWKASDELTIKNIASYSEFRERSSFSLFGDNFTSDFGRANGFVPYPVGAKFNYILLNPKPGGNNAAQSTFTEELQFQGRTDDGRLTWQAGGYTEISNPIGFNDSYTGILADCTSVKDLACTNIFGIGQINDSQTKFRFRNYGLYAQGTFTLTDQLSVTGGFRYTWDTTSAYGQSTRLAPQANGTFIRTCNDVVHFYNGKPGTPLVVNNATQCGYSPPDEKSSAPTWIIDFDYKPIQDVLLYAKYSRGYRAGGINLTSIGLEGWKPEHVDAYEVGAKASFRGSSLSGYFNIAGFYNKLKNMQLPVSAISNVAGFAGSNPEVNAGEARIQGVEVDASATLFDSLKFDVGYTFLDAKLLTINVPAVPAGAPYAALIPSSVAGGRLAQTPRNRVSLTGTYTLPLEDTLGRISFGATFVHTDSQVLPIATAPQFQNQPATDILNLNVSWKNVLGQPVDVAFFATNVTNQIYPIAVGGSYFTGGFENLLYGPPRMYGFRLRYSFGQ